MIFVFQSQAFDPFAPAAANSGGGVQEEGHVAADLARQGVEPRGGELQVPESVEGRERCGCVTRTASQTCLSWYRLVKRDPSALAGCLPKLSNVRPL